MGKTVKVMEVAGKGRIRNTKWRWLDNTRNDLSGRTIRRGSARPG